MVVFGLLLLLSGIIVFKENPFLLGVMGVGSLAVLAGFVYFIEATA